ncbi:MAG: phosphonate C-P lyase system protein PhnH [Longicatena sp.]
MKFDMVFDVQKAFRKVIKAFSYPGDIHSLAEEVQYMDHDWSCYPSTRLLMHMLLDTDTSFALASSDSTLAVRFSNMTYCPCVDVREAAYIFVCGASSTSLQELIEQANEGTLKDPQLGATMIIECEELSSSHQYRVQGPGIQTEKSIGIRMKEEWMLARNEKNKEFPLGIDLIFVDRKNNMMALPRTTRIERN